MVIRWKKQARYQLREILDYHRVQASRKVARKIRVRIMKTVNRLIAFPQLGSVLSDFDDELKIYRSIVANKNYKVIYYIEGKIIYIFAIWDVRQDPQKLNIK